MKNKTFLILSLIALMSTFIFAAMNTITINHFVFNINLSYFRIFLFVIILFCQQICSK